MLDAEDEISAGNERPKHPTDEPRKLLDIVKRQRPKSQTEGLLRPLKAVQVSPEIAHARIGRLRSRPREHIFGQIDAQHAGRALGHRPSGEPAEAATKIDDPLSA